MKVDDALRGVSSIAFDTAPIIYFIEANPAYDKLVSKIFNAVATGELSGWTSVISLSEVLVQPFITGRDDLRQAYRELLLNSSNFHTLPINASAAENAAHMRAKYGLRLPDAIQIASLLMSVARQSFAMITPCAGSTNYGSCYWMTLSFDV